MPTKPRGKGLLTFERRHQPLLPRRQFLGRVVRNAAIALGIVAISLGIGILGYHTFEGLSWIDSLVNASMLLGGMGPVDPLRTTAGKIFASFYALFSGIIFLVAAGVLFAPIYHRFLHHFHLDLDDDQDDRRPDGRKTGGTQGKNRPR